MNSILELRDVIKTYGKKTVVNRVGFQVPKGKIFGLLGPNGAGKTTLIRIITTIIGADAGTVLIDGEKLSAKHPAQIGYMPEERGLYKKMKVGEHLMYLAQLKGLSKKEAQDKLKYWFTKFDIMDWWTKKVEELSKGMQQKIQFVATVVHEPKLLILDEPFSGLDPINTNLIKDEIDQLHQNGTSIIFSTHRMEQVEAVCENIVLINHGQKILEGEVAAIKDNYKDNLFRFDFYEGVPELPDTLEVKQQHKNSILVQLENETEATSILRHFLDQGIRLRGFNEILPTLNEIFIKTVNDPNLNIKPLS